MSEATDFERGDIDQVWAYRGRQLRLVCGPLGYEGEVWERGSRRMRVRFGPVASRQTAMQATELAAFELGPLPPDESAE